jgi:hypothetical protein
VQSLAISIQVFYVGRAVVAIDIFWEV